MNPLDFSRIKDEAHPEDFLSEMKPFGDLMMYYRCAMMEVETKFKVLNEQFSTQYNRNPIESIKTRLKKPASIIEKIKRKNYITFHAAQQPAPLQFAYGGSKL